MQRKKEAHLVQPDSPERSSRIEIQHTLPVSDFPSDGIQDQGANRVVRRCVTGQIARHQSRSYAVACGAAVENKITHSFFGAS